VSIKFKNHLNLHLVKLRCNNQFSTLLT